jgi:hypothetical protein
VSGLRWWLPFLVLVAAGWAGGIVLGLVLAGYALGHWLP